MANFSPINFPDGSSYTAEEVEWICNDYMSMAERSIDKKRRRSRYQHEWDKHRDAEKMNEDVRYESAEITPFDERTAFIKKVKDAKDYEWIVAVACARNEIDPMHSLRIRAYTKDTVTGKSMVDRMMDRYIDICTNDVLTYENMARAKFLRSEIELLSKKGMPERTPNTVIFNNIGTNKKEPTQVVDVQPVTGLKAK